MTVSITIKQAVNAYLDTIRTARSGNTALTYRNGLSFFTQVLEVHGISLEKTPVSELTEESIIWLASSLKVFASTTEKLYLTAVHGFFQYLIAENLSTVNLPKIEMLIKQRGRRPGIRLPQFPADSIEQIIYFLSDLNNLRFSSGTEKLRELRDRAFLITLGDTGLRVHEACNLRRGDIDWNEGHAMIIGKGNRQDVARFSQRSLAALRDYINARASLDGASNRPLASLPLFARHDKGAGHKVKPITTTTGRNIVSERVEQILGKEAVGTITPHSFRHFFVTKVLKGSGNLKLAQELARHKNITVTQRYAHLSDDELDKGYWEIFEEDKKTPG
jgi:integrase/recombinase XerC